MSVATLPARESQEPDGAERRVAPRVRTLKRAKIVFNNGFSTFDCILRNISATGALLTIDEAAHLPREFHIRIGEEKTTRFAKLVYRRGMFAGIHFLDAEPTVLYGDTLHAAPAEHAAAPAVHHHEDELGHGIRRIEPETLPSALRRTMPWARFGS